MKYNRFEELPVWNAAIGLAVDIYKITSEPCFSGRGNLRDQNERAAVSISNNIAERFERGTKHELRNFLYIARGSAGEVRSMLCLLERLPGFSNLKFEISNLKSNAEEISRQLRGWADFLQESPIKGQKYLTEKARTASRAKADREEFLKELRRIQTGTGD
ncbi:MAG TPA: four helix bundle protein [Candidatus Sulfotelmatobacter sp.]|nr:four helix bundle protein [Candidatus Sulfotelmatobacter sp.]